MCLRFTTVDPPKTDAGIRDVAVPPHLHKALLNPTRTHADDSVQNPLTLNAVDRDQIVPVDKFDLAAAGRAVALGWPGVEPVITDLLEWIRDYNWPVAHSLTPLLRSIGEPIAPYLAPILDGDDCVWKYWVIELLLTDAAPGLVRRFSPLLERIADHPTDQERTEELDQVAAAALGRGD